MILLWSRDGVDKNSQIPPLPGTIGRRFSTGDRANMAEVGWVLPKFYIEVLKYDVVSFKTLYLLLFALENPSLFRGAPSKVRTLKDRTDETPFLSEGKCRSRDQSLMGTIFLKVFLDFFAGTKEFSPYWLQTEMEFHSWKVKHLKVKAQWILITTVQWIAWNFS